MYKNYTTKLLLTLSIAFLGFSVNAQIIPNGTYNIFNPNLSEVISVNTIPENQPGNPQNVIIGRARMEAPSSTNSLQEWTFMHQGNDIYKITNVGNNTILGVKDGWCGDFGDVQVGFNDSDTSTLFKIVNGVAANTFVFQIGFDASCNFGSSNNPIKVFDIDGGTSGSKINTFTGASANANQEFQILALGVLSIDDSFLSNALSIYYQANAGLVINSKQTNIDKLSVTIYDISGREIKSTSIINNTEATIKLNTLSKGIYLAHISDAFNHKLVKKFIVN